MIYCDIFYDTLGLAPHINFNSKATFQKTTKTRYILEYLKSSFRKYYGRYRDLIKQYEISLS